MGKLQGKVAIVTGASKGIGFAIAQSLAREGAHVYVNGRTQERVDTAMAAIRSQAETDRVDGIVADFSSTAGAEAVISELPAVDVLVNNVGIFEPKPFTEIPDADWYRFFEVNVMSGVRLSRHYLAGMLKKNWGRIIFVSSETGVNVPPDMIAYGTTKAAQIALARGLAETTKATAVTVNCVLPGPTKSEGIEKFLNSLLLENGLASQKAEDKFLQSLRPTSLIQRFAQPEEVASTICYLASPLSSATNGAAIRVEGGLLRSIL